jgi:hypothetical protein
MQHVGTDPRQPCLPAQEGDQEVGGHGQLWYQRDHLERLLEQVEELVGGLCEAKCWTHGSRACGQPEV